MASRWSLWGGVLILGLTACGSTSSQNPDSSQTPASSSDARGSRGSELAIAVETAIAQLAPPSGRLDLTGSTRPVQVVTLRARLEGQLLDLLVDVGDAVNTGQVLARQEETVLKAGVVKDEAELASQRAELAQARGELTRTQTDLAAASLRWQQLQKESERLQQLAQQGAISRQDAEQSLTLAQTAQQDVQSAQAALSVQQEALAAAEAQVKAQQAVVSQSRERLGYTLLRSPLRGVVLQRWSEAGTILSAGDEILQVGDLSRIVIDLAVSDLERVPLQVGQSVAVRLDALPDQPLTGSISRISPAADPVTRQIPVEVSVPNPDGRLGSGLLARVRWDPPLQAPSIYVAQSAVSRKGESRIFVISPPGSGLAQTSATVTARTVTLGPTEDGQVEIRSGLQVGEQFVVRSSRPLQDGQEVRLSVLSK